MGIKTIAECVETEAVWRRVLELNIDFAQGFYIDRPHLWLSQVASTGIAPSLNFEFTAKAPSTQS